MLALALVLSLLIGFVVAAGVIGREARRLGSQRREPVWRLEEAAHFVEDELPADTAAGLDPDGLRSLLRWHLNQLQDGRSEGPQPDVSDDRANTNELYRHARSEGMEVTRPVVDDVVRAHLSYLERIGALGVAEA